MIIVGKDACVIIPLSGCTGEFSAKAQGVNIFSGLISESEIIAKHVYLFPLEIITEVLQMTDKQVLIREIEALPPQVIKEVYDYVCLLQVKRIKDRKIDDITLASEQALADDWLLPEEDLAWANL